MKRIFYLLAFPILLGAGCSQVIVAPVPKPQPIACTMEAKQCPDGSYVSRTGPNCEFSPCPIVPVKPVAPPPATLTSGIEGIATLGPTCPVERVPPDPACADRPYPTTILVETVDGQKQITHFTTADDGTFKIELAPGSYSLVPLPQNLTSQKSYPRGQTQQVIVEKNKFTHVIISFDSGIR